MTDVMGLFLVLCAPGRHASSNRGKSGSGVNGWKDGPWPAGGARKVRLREERLESGLWLVGGIRKI